MLATSWPTWSRPPPAWHALGDGPSRAGGAHGGAVRRRRRGTLSRDTLTHRTGRWHAGRPGRGDHGRCPADHCQPGPHGRTDGEPARRQPGRTGRAVSGASRVWAPRRSSCATRSAASTVSSAGWRITPPTSCWDVTTHRGVHTVMETTSVSCQAAVIRRNGVALRLHPDAAEGTPSGSTTLPAQPAENVRQHRGRGQRRRHPAPGDTPSAGGLLDGSRIVVVPSTEPASASTRVLAGRMPRPVLMRNRLIDAFHEDGRDVRG
jgi:hypothetical protein